MANIYSKTQGHHCWWLNKNGKSLANFDDEKEVDAIIEMQSKIAELERDLLDYKEQVNRFE